MSRAPVRGALALAVQTDNGLRVERIEHETAVDVADFARRYVATILALEAPTLVQIAESAQDLEHA